MALAAVDRIDGGIVNVDTTGVIVTLTRFEGRRYSLKAKDATVYIQTNADDVDADDSSKERKWKLEDEDPMVLPDGTTKFAAKTASGTALLLVLRD